MSSIVVAPLRPGNRPVRDPEVLHRRLHRRQRVNLAIQALCTGATLVSLFFLGSILLTLVWHGIGALQLSVLTEVTKPPGSGGGLLNAIIGSLIQTTLGMLIGAPLGLLAGTYLAEYAGASALGSVVRFVSDILLSAPSILIGLFIYGLLVKPLGGFSGIAGAFALAVIVIPIVVRTTEDMLRLMPAEMREAAIALGAPKWNVTIFICYRAARRGILTGILLAVARIAGETAPLLFTSFGNLNWSLALTRPMASLPLTIYQYAGSAFNEWVRLAWAGALLITVGVLATNIFARIVLRERGR